MRILYLSPTGSLGGAERVLLSVLEGLRQFGPEFESCLLALADGPLLERAAQLGVRTAVLRLPAELAELGDSQLCGVGSAPSRLRLARRALRALPSFGCYARRFHQAVRTFAPDLIHSNGIKTHLLASLAAPRRVLILWHAHDFYNSRPLVRPLLRAASRRAVGVLAISRAIARDVRALLPLTRVRVVYNAIDVARFAPGLGDGAWLDAQAGFSPAQGPVVRVGLVATYARWKGHDVFMEAAARVQREPLPVPVRFYVIGGPIYQTAGSQFSAEELRALAARWRVAEHVGLVPFQPDPVNCYRALDVAVHASTRPEPFGLTIIEAMGCGRAVVAVQAGGAAELFTPGHDALGVPAADPGALAAAVRTLISDPKQRLRLGGNARRTTANRFSTALLPDQIRDAYIRFSQRRSAPF